MSERCLASSLPAYIAPLLSIGPPAYFQTSGNEIAKWISGAIERPFYRLASQIYPLFSTLQLSISLFMTRVTKYIVYAGTYPEIENI